MAVQMGARPVTGDRTRQTRPSGAKVGSGHIVIVSALFLVLFAATLLVGGHAAIDPLVQQALQPPPDPHGAAAVVYAMPDGIFCRRVSFDNVTAQVTEGPIERCAGDAAARGRFLQDRAFSWAIK